MSQPVLEMRGISKNFAMTKALDGILGGAAAG